MKKRNHFPKNTLLVLFFLSLLLLIIIANMVKQKEEPKEIQIIKKEAPIIDYTNFELAMSHLKQQETLSLISYEMDGHTYIGYGQQIKNSPKEKEITEAEAETMLKETFQNYLLFVNKRYDIYGNELLALSLLWYNVKPESIRNSKLEQELQKNRSDWNKDVIRDSWLSLCNFQGKQHEKLKERREFEVKLFFATN